MCLPSNGPAGWTGMASFPCLVTGEMPPGTIGATSNQQSSQASVGLITRENRSMKGLLSPRHNIVSNIFYCAKQGACTTYLYSRSRETGKVTLQRLLDTGKGREWNHSVTSLPHITPDKSTISKRWLI